MRGRGAGRLVTLETMKFPQISAVLLGALLLSGCAAGAATSSSPAPTGSTSAAPSPAGAGADCSGVLVVADFGILDSQPVEVCVDADGALTAQDAIAEAGISLEGNADYGDAVVCRVNGRPGPEETVTVEGQQPFVEPCSSMSPPFAFWALWVRSADAEWGFAMEGVTTQRVEPGQAVGLVYTTGTGTEPTPPAAG